MTRDHADNDDHADRDSAVRPTATSMALGRGLRSEALFFLTSYAFSWSIWLPVAAMDGGPSALRNLAVGVAAAGPSLAGVVCTGVDEGWSGVRRLLRSLLQWRVAAKWYAVSLAGPITVALMAVGVHRLLIGNDAEFRLQATTILLVPIALVVTLFMGPLQEELGWRGYALPRLLRRWSSVRASLVLGVAWACWHLPLYGLDAGGQERAPLVLFLVSVVALSIVYTWLWLSTGRSLLIAVLLHSAINVAGVLLLRDAGSDFGPVAVATVFTIALAAVAARHFRRMSRASSNSRGP